MKLLLLALSYLVFVLHIPYVSAVEPVRSQEIAQCRSGELVTWNDGKDKPSASSTLRFFYSHSGAPEWFTESLTAKMVTKAAAEWSQCGIIGLVIDGTDAKLQSGAIRIQWNDKESRGNFGLANLTKRTLSLGPKAFVLLKSKNPAHDARETLQMVISHEMGHFFGLMAHSRRCVDVLSYYDNGKGDRCISRDPSQFSAWREYRHILPTSCDIERCRKINGFPPLIDGRLER